MLESEWRSLENGDKLNIIATFAFLRHGDRSAKCDLAPRSETRPSTPPSTATPNYGTDPDNMSGNSDILSSSSVERLNLGYYGRCRNAGSIMPSP